MEKADLKMLESLGLRDGGGRTWRTFKRNGHLLLLLPDDGQEARRGMSLYRPQRLAARLFAGVISRLPGGYRLLGKFNADLVKEGILETVLKDTDSSLAGILLGNPTQKERRAILLFSSESEGLSVVKSGTTAAAITQISRERQFLEENAGQFSGMPKLLNSWNEESWEAFAIPFCENRGAVSVDEMSTLLGSWILNEAPVLLSSISEWNEVMNDLKHSEKSDFSNLKVRETLCHRDFTPWNVLASGNDTPIVIDWESGRNSGVPGWDLVHYLFLSATLVKRMSDAEAVASIKSVLQNNPNYQRLLARWGWDKNINLLIESYFYSMKDLLDHFQELADSVSAA